MSHNATQINALLRKLAIADRHNRDRGWQGAVNRKTEAVQILRELAALKPDLFTLRLRFAEMELWGANAWLRNPNDK